MKSKRKGNNTNEFSLSQETNYDSTASAVQNEFVKMSFKELNISIRLSINFLTIRLVDSPPLRSTLSLMPLMHKLMHKCRWEVSQR